MTSGFLASNRQPGTRCGWVGVMSLLCLHPDLFIKWLCVCKSSSILHAGGALNKEENFLVKASTNNEFGCGDNN
jgi:hypothetical protein